MAFVRTKIFGIRLVYERSGWNGITFSLFSNKNKKSSGNP